MTLLGAAAPAARASPGFDDAVLPVPGADPNAGNTEASHVRPRPPRGLGWRKGGLSDPSIVQSGFVLS